MYNGNMQILIYENVNYTKVGSMQSISLAPIGATLELNGKAYRIIDGMRRRGYSEEDIKKVCYDNFYNRFKDKIVSL